MILQYDNNCHLGDVDCHSWLVISEFLEDNLPFGKYYSSFFAGSSELSIDCLKLFSFFLSPVLSAMFCWHIDCFMY